VDSLLRDGVLAGVRVHVSGDGELAQAVRTACGDLDAELTADDVAVLVHDADGAFTAGVAGVHAVLDGTWDVVRPAADPSRGGKVLLLAPRPGDPHRAAARAGLENLARTLGIEWARFGIRTVTLLPGAFTTAEEVAQLVAYLASPAGDYFSGCAITLGAVDAPGA
jgi:NAD(P)-dependent dehydrogenase (short-subunit alcohol dehydrogenase family)